MLFIKKTDDCIQNPTKAKYSNEVYFNMFHMLYVKLAMTFKYKYTQSTQTNKYIDICVCMFSFTILV